MHGMNQLVKLPQLNNVMMVMSREMEKAGLIEETIDDVMDADPDLDEEADVQLDMGMTTNKTTFYCFFINTTFFFCAFLLLFYSA